MLISDGFAERAPEGIFPERGVEIQRLYAQWERGRISDDAFKSSLEAMGLFLGREAKNMIRKSTGARTLNYGKFVSLLQVDEDDGRRARSHVGNGGYPRSHPGSQATDEKTPRSATPRGERHASITSQGEAATPRSSTRTSEASVAPLPASMRKVISDFVDGRMSSASLRKHLRRHGVSLTQDLERLILQHESDNKVNFREIARLVMRQSDPIDPRDEAMRMANVGPGGFPWERSRSSLGLDVEEDLEGLEGAGVYPPWDTSATAKNLMPHLFLQCRGKKYFSEKAIRGLSELAGDDSKTGGFLQWPDGQPAGSSTPRQPMNRPVSKMAHALGWDEDVSPRLVRSRSLGPHMEAPFGRSSDLPPTPKHRHSIAKPFGTCKDERVRTDQMGTVEYLPADQRSAVNRDCTPPRSRIKRQDWDQHHASPLHGNKYFDNSLLSGKYLQVTN
jgi:hypothetical protein